MDGNHIAGTALGFIAGIYKAISTILAITTISWITWVAVFDTASLALIGGALGWIGAEAMRQIKKFISRHDKKSS